MEKFANFYRIKLKIWLNKIAHFDLTKMLKIIKIVKIVRQ